MPVDSFSARIMDGNELASALARLAGELLKRYADCRKLAVVGIQRRGVFLASRLKTLLDKELGRNVPEGVLDINLYRDDWTTLGPRAVIGRSMLNFDVNDSELVLVDDVLFTGRTIRAALEALADFGRPRKVELLALVDRGHRELPIHADYIGKTIHTEHDERVDVMLSELDGRDEVLLIRRV